ncbi:hypothetical protein D3C75_822550 [compost metagenome]
MISSGVKSRWKPCLPVEQNEQSNAQPTCDEIHKVLRKPVLSSAGINTVSTKDPAPSPTRKTHLRVPSFE